MDTEEFRCQHSVNSVDLVEGGAFASEIKRKNLQFNFGLKNDRVII